MAKRKKTKKISSKASVKTIDVQANNLTAIPSRATLTEQLRLGESYISLVLGAVVVLVLFLVFFVFIKGDHSRDSSKAMKQKPTTTNVQNPSQKTYTLGEGESIWDVAVKFYGDGYQWTKIADANHLGDSADYIEPGTKLVIPNLK